MGNGLLVTVPEQRTRLWLQWRFGGHAAGCLGHAAFQDLQRGRGCEGAPGQGLSRVRQAKAGVKSRWCPEPREINSALVGPGVWQAGE